MATKGKYNITDMTEDDENTQFKYEEELFPKNLPVKPHMRKIEENISSIKSELNENIKHGQILRGENISLEHRTKEKCNDITKSLMDDLFNFDKDLQRIMQNDKAETNFFKQQLNALNQDKLKLQQSVIILDSKMKSCETDVGIGYLAHN